MRDFPTDVIFGILLRLSVIPLLRFRCVSKSFCALIDSHDFIRSHVKRLIETKTHLGLWIRDSSLYSVDLDSLDRAVELDHPLKSRNYATEVLGSCDGLVCLYNEENIAIWNPSTRRFQKLPVPEIEFPDYFTSCQYSSYGFGYDYVTDDYKLVRFIELYRDAFWGPVYSEVRIYSMKSNSWRRIPDFPYYHRYKRCCGELVGSALHWVVGQKRESDISNLIGAFDLTTEVYQLLPQPEFSDKNFQMDVGELEGCLCILCTYIDVRVDAWVMKEYGVEESWAKLFSVVQPEVIRSFEVVRPLAYSNGDFEDLLVQYNKKLIWHDLEVKKIKKIKSRGIPDYFELFVYVESIVPLRGGGETYGKIEDIKRKKKNTPKRTGKRGCSRSFCRCGLYPVGGSLELQPLHFLNCNEGILFTYSSFSSE